MLSLVFVSALILSVNDSLTWHCMANPMEDASQTSKEVEAQLGIDLGGGISLPGSRVVGGGAANITEAPYTAAILVDGQGTGMYAFACGAVIVTRNHVITSAQCVARGASFTRVSVGSTMHSSGGQRHLVARIKIHENFNSPTAYNHDIAILYLSAPIVLGPNAQTVTLPIQGASIPENTNCMFYGWGATFNGGNPVASLLKVALPIVNQARCVSSYAGQFFITDNMVCAGRMGVGGVGACRGDTGGPLVNNNILYGIQSFGRGCAEPNYPTVFTRIPMYRNWLNVNLQ